MARILFLAHRLPYPPNKGDKVRSYHLLRHLAERHEVVLGTFVDDPQDECHVATIEAWCAALMVRRLRPRAAAMRSLLSSWVRHEPFTLTCFHDAAMAGWVSSQLAKGDIDAVVVFSSAMAQYVDSTDVPVFIDFVDVDSQKWAEYASASTWPMSWLFAREAGLLRAFEARAARRAEQVYFVTQREAAVFAAHAGSDGSRVVVAGNGVDAEYFSPALNRERPFRTTEQAIVFTGEMGYRPNVEAVSWFCREVLPLVCDAMPRARLWIVGRRPERRVRRLSGATVVVTGAVDDVRPWLQHADAVVAPMRMARGIHNKILEAMAMARAVVTTPAAAESLPGSVRHAVLEANDARSFAREVIGLLADPSRATRLGLEARDAAKRELPWPAGLARIREAVDRRVGIPEGVPV